MATTPDIDPGGPVQNYAPAQPRTRPTPPALPPGTQLGGDWQEGGGKAPPPPGPTPTPRDANWRSTVMGGNKTSWYDQFNASGSERETPRPSPPATPPTPGLVKPWPRGTSSPGGNPSGPPTGGPATPIAATPAASTSSASQETTAPAGSVQARMAQSQADVRRFAPGEGPTVSRTRNGLAGAGPLNPEVDEARERAVQATLQAGRLGRGGPPRVPARGRRG